MAAASVERDRYEITASFRRTSYGIIPLLKVVRLSDGRLIYPFQGCADMPLCADAQSATKFAEAWGEKLVSGDIAVPE
ncbi:DUF6723 family protein [Paraburkholderia phosphatilytica]|uniref:DUF6723 family protein n=1 Tax=Paraburkholderia phosphatilytica TaxID=2282883 RepID=UPI001F0CD011|nr:DUF6723 family protein [Paraburkholderia phosphatilytica]